MQFLYAISTFIDVFWPVSGMLVAIGRDLGINRKDPVFSFVLWMYHLGKPVYLPMLPVHLFFVWADPELTTIAKVIVTVASVVSWLVYHDIDNDDDRWKRLKDKLKEKVEVMGSKLVTVPVEA